MRTFWRKRTRSAPPLEERALVVVEVAAAAPFDDNEVALASWCWEAEEGGSASK
jgi:hypothetical protein